MFDATYAVRAVQGGWAIEQPAGDPLMFFSGGRAEAKARELAQVTARVRGVSVQVLIHDRSGALIGSQRYHAPDPGLARCS